MRKLIKVELTEVETIAVVTALATNIGVLKIDLAWTADRDPTLSEAIRSRIAKLESALKALEKAFMT